MHQRKGLGAQSTQGGLLPRNICAPSHDTHRHPARRPRERDLLNIPAFFPPEAPARISKQSGLIIEQRQLSDKETVWGYAQRIYDALKVSGSLTRHSLDPWRQPWIIYGADHPWCRTHPEVNLLWRRSPRGGRPQSQACVQQCDASKKIHCDICTLSDLSPSFSVGPNTANCSLSSSSSSSLSPEVRNRWRSVLMASLVGRNVTKWPTAEQKSSQTEAPVHQLEMLLHDQTLCRRFF